MEGDMVENVVPLGAREDMDGAPCRELSNLLEVMELVVSALLEVDSGLDIPFRAARACSRVDISFAVRCMVDKLTGPLRSVSRDSGLEGTAIGGAVPGI